MVALLVCFHRDGGNSYACALPRIMINVQFWEYHGALVESEVEITLKSPLFITPQRIKCSVTENLITRFRKIGHPH